MKTNREAAKIAKTAAKREEYARRLVSFGLTRPQSPRGGVRLFDLLRAGKAPLSPKRPHPPRGGRFDPSTHSAREKVEQCKTLTVFGRADLAMKRFYIGS